MLVKNDHLVLSEYTDFHISMNPFTPKPMYQQMCARVHFDQKRLVARPQWGNNELDATQYEE